ncbi:hypothetical protein L6249_00280 [Candidatus Parcubacteria bacterium]|nr:hypothetical protein [Patescibacteria group bacterium]MBU4347051.1 hypothetical protein [Patescibacteria group bacterium]MCG2690499.1 hypothetical protein [Candidatus Parcubacteria bacterium]
MTKLLKIVLPIILFFCFLRPALAQDKVNLYFFYGDGCPHCANEEKILNALEKEYKDIKINRYEVWNNRDNAQFLATLGRELGLDVSGVPLLIIGDKTFVGFYSAETTGRQIKAAVEDYLINGCEDVVEPVLKNQQDKQGHAGDCDGNCYGNCYGKKELPDKINLPLLGETEIKNLSLPVLTIAISAVDGFNPCAMWVLLFLISLLLGMADRKKMWILGSVFIIASGAVYFLFLSAWLNLFLFLGFVFWIRISIGIVALVSGGFHLRDWWLNRKGCPVAGGEKRKLIFEKIRAVIQTKTFWLAFLGIIILACAVNLVELVCSAGLPAVYTQILALAHLPAWQYYGYLLLYIFIFMLDDMFVFIIAMATLEMKAISSRYTRWSGLIGGIIMLIIGILLLFKPGWLMFG